MTDCVGTVTDFSNVREAVCISARKIMDACRDQACMEGLPVYLTEESQQTLETAASVRARSAELLLAEVEVAPMQYQTGYYCVSCRYFYRVICDATVCGVRPVTIYGLATAEKTCTLYGGEGEAGTWTSDGLPAAVQPTGVVEAVDPVCLCAGMAEGQDIQSGCPLGTLPEAVQAAFDGELVWSGMGRQLLVTLGQFSLVRLERQTQLLIPSYDYCMPAKGCTEGDCGCPEDPCQAFSRMQFPVSAFFPVDEGTTVCGEGGCGPDQGPQSGPRAPRER